MRRCATPTGTRSSLPCRPDEGTAERDRPQSATVLYPATSGQGKCAGLTSPGGERCGGGAAVVPGDGYVTFRGVGTDQVSGFRAGSTRNMAKNRLGEAAIDADVLAGNVS
jgi:hypothetical protein